MDDCSRTLEYPIERKAGFCVAHLDADLYRGNTKPPQETPSGDFIRIHVDRTECREHRAHPDHGSWRLRLIREGDDQSAHLNEERTLPERVERADANNLFDRREILLTEPEQRWLRDALTEMLGEIVDVEALKHEIETLRVTKTPVNVFAQLANVIGDRCGHCGSEIDPDYCHCGERIDSHDRWNDPHAPVPMGCVCGYSEPDLETLAKSRGELLIRQRRALTHLAKKLEQPAFSTPSLERRLDNVRQFLTSVTEHARAERARVGIAGAHVELAQMRLALTLRAELDGVVARCDCGHSAYLHGERGDDGQSYVRCDPGRGDCRCTASCERIIELAYERLGTEIGEASAM